MIQVYDIKQISEMFGCSERHVYDLISEKKLRAKRFGKKYWVREEWIVEYLEKEDNHAVAALRAVL